ncbi:hypothetical protein [uncultured Bartonella sp.]|uniref:hypothetical protein n=1 Tax=uncultured Bartonella sp. TaxID=104108 RepID=UPI002612A512|nr:hypothetical protein [uncultured Bartonella sp.]
MRSDLFIAKLIAYSPPKAGADDAKNRIELSQIVMSVNFNAKQRCNVIEKILFYVSEICRDTIVKANVNAPFS